MARILNDSLLTSLHFTRSTGKRPGGEPFADAISVGGYPAEQYIVKIVSIEVYMSDTSDSAVVAGVIVTYEMATGEKKTVVHGDVSGPRAGGVHLKENELLTGATGKLKDVSDETKNRRISFIQFVVFERDSGLTCVHGPFGSITYVCDPWGSYGPILALEGTVGSYGLDSLGFTRLVQGVPGFGILGH